MVKKQKLEFTWIGKDEQPKLEPRQAANLMRKLSDATGMKMGAGMEEALSRLERGEDPEKIEEEMGGLLEGEEPFTFEGRGKKGGRKPKPNVDETLYELNDGGIY